MIDDLKNDKNQFDLDQLCTLVMEEKDLKEDRKLLKVSKSLAILARLTFS